MTTTPEGRAEPLSPEERDDLRVFALRATQGPWKADGTIYEHMVAEIRSIVPGEERGIAQVWQHQRGFADARFIAAANPATVLSLLAALEEAEGREGARVDKVEKIGCRAAELTFDWLCGEFEDLPNKLAEDMSVKITDSIIWALGEGSVIDDFADAEQQVLELTARAEASEQREAGLRAQVDGLRPEVLAFAHLMEAQLRANDHKPGWKEEFADELFPRIQEEAEELREAIAHHGRQVSWGEMALFLPQSIAEVGREAADVANFAMMIADVCGALTTKSGEA